ncbi:MAG: hypothetical protein ACP5SH_20135 [Syntrophobacteraceae bacterium]
MPLPRQYLDSCGKVRQGNYLATILAVARAIPEELRAAAILERDRERTSGTGT